MRIRVQSSPPLSPFKAWYCPQNDNTILDLKTSICDVLPPLRDSNIEAHEISLLLDDFELFDNIPLDAVRDGDLVLCVINCFILFALLRSKPGSRKGLYSLTSEKRTMLVCF